MTSTIPTPADFMTMSDGPDFDVDALQGFKVAYEPPAPGPSVDLTGVLAHLERIEALIQAPAELEQQAAELQESCTALKVEHDASQRLIAETLEAVRKSTSKVANQVREILQPEPLAPVPVDPESTPEPLSDTNPLPQAPQCPACKRYFADGALLERHECVPEASQKPPASDAPAEEWREYARCVGVLPDEPDAIDSMNRSQIRSMLGLPHPGVDAGEGSAV